MKYIENHWNEVHWSISQNININFWQQEHYLLSYLVLWFFSTSFTKWNECSGGLKVFEDAN